MKWEVFVKILLNLTLQALVGAILWFSDDLKVTAMFLIAVSSISWIGTLWSVWEDVKQSKQVQQVIRTQ